VRAEAGLGRRAEQSPSPAFFDDTMRALSISPVSNGAVSGAKGVLTLFQNAPLERTPKRTPTVLERVGECGCLLAFVGLISNLVCPKC